VLDSYRSQLDAVDRDRLAFGQAAAGTIAGRFADVVQICERHREIAVDDLMWPKFVFLLSFTSAWVDPDRALALLDEIEERAGPSPMAAYGRATVALTNRRYDDAIEMILTILDVTELNQLETAEAFRRPGGNPLGHVLQALATGLHLVDRNDEATAILAHAVEVGTDLFQHYPTVLAAVIHAAQADHHTARELLALSVATVQHAAIPLGSSDCAIAAAALAYRTGHPHLASDTLAAVRAVRGFRTEASVALYRGYVDLTRLALGDVQRRPDVRPIDEALDHALHALNISPA